MIIKEYVNYKKQSLLEEIGKLNPVPHFVIIQVNEDEGSNAYVKGKIKDHKTYRHVKQTILTRCKVELL